MPTNPAARRNGLASQHPSAVVQPWTDACSLRIACSWVRDVRHKLVEMGYELEPEDWWQLDAVQQLLCDILEAPSATHPSAAAAVPGGVLLDAHVHGLVRALEKLVGARK
eukprot:6949865-Prymnesium_polylepis.1